MSELVDKYRHTVQDKPDDPEKESPSAKAARYPSVSPPSHRLKKSALSRPGWDALADQDVLADQDDEALDPSGALNPSVEQVLEQELANSLSGFEAEGNVPAEDPDRRFERACTELVNKAREEMRQEADEDVEADLAKIQATNMAMMHQSSPRDFYRPDPQENPDFLEKEPDRVTVLPKSRSGPPGQYRSPSLATGMTAVLLAVASTGVLLDVHKHPLVVEGVTWSSQLLQSEPEQTISSNATQEPVPVTAKEAEPVKIEPASKGDKVVVEVTKSPPPAEPVAVAAISERMVSGQEPASKLESAREELDVLTVNLKLTEAYLARLQQTIKTGNPEDTASLKAEVLKVEREIDSLRSSILALDAPSQAPRVKESGSLAQEQKPIRLTTDGGATALALAAVNTQPVTEEKPTVSRSRDARLVEVAIASTPGLKTLDQAQRDQLQQKLVAGECLVPALTSVFPQVPVLVMRDMVRQLEDGC